MTGAYKTVVKYHAPGGRAEYRESLPEAVRRFVVHDPMGMAAMNGSSVPVVLDRAVFRHIAPGSVIPGTLWDPDYQWSEATQLPVVPVDAPTEERTAFLAAVLTLRDTITPAIRLHYRTHLDQPEDPVVRAVDWLIALGNVAEGLGQ